MRTSIYECLFNNNRQCQIEVDIIRHRQKIEAELNEKIPKNDPRDIVRINKLQMHLGLILSNEPNIECLIKRHLAVSNATLHEYILRKLKEVTLKFSKTLKNNTQRETAKLEEELNDLVNSNDPNSAAKIRNLEEELNLKEQEHLERELQFKENFTLLEDEKPTRNFLNLESTKL